MSQKIKTSVEIDGSLTTGEYGVSAGHVKLDTTPTNIPTSVGTLYWDTANRTAALIDGDGDTTLQIGQEERVLVHNNTGSTLTDGQIVYISGSTGELPSVTLASASSETTSAATLGMVTESIAHGADGFITISGVVHGLNTLAFNEGDLLWLGTTAGTFTATKPVSPNHLVLIGYVVKKAGGNGSVLVKIQNTQELEECSDVLFTGLTGGDILAYSGAPTNLWENKTIPAVLGYTPANQAISISTTAPLQGGGNLSANRTLSITQASSTTNGYLSSTDWNTFNNKQNALTNPITGTGTTNYLSKFTGSTSLGNSLIYDNGTNVGIGTTSPQGALDIRQANKVFDGYGNLNVFTTGADAQDVGGSIALGGPSYGGTTPYPFAKIQGIKEGGAAWTGSLIFGTTQSNSAVTEKMRITGSGNVGIGTTSPVQKLHVEGGSYFGSDVFTMQNGGIFFDANGSYGSGIYGRNSGDDLVLQAGGTERMRITSAGNVGIGTTSPSYKLDISGYVQATGFYNSSDIRLKNLIDYQYNVESIKPITYTWKDSEDKSKKIGYSAQEVQKVLPDAVSENNEGFLSVDYIQVLVAKIEMLEEKLRRHGLE